MASTLHSSQVIDLDGEDHWEGFHAACYRKKEETEEHCFTTEVRRNPRTIP